MGTTTEPHANDHDKNWRSIYIGHDTGVKRCTACDLVREGKSITRTFAEHVVVGSGQDPIPTCFVILKNDGKLSGCTEREMWQDYVRKTSDRMIKVGCGRWHREYQSYMKKLHAKDVLFSTERSCGCRLIKNTDFVAGMLQLSQADFQGCPHERGEKFDAAVAQLIGFQDKPPSSATSKTINSVLAKWDSKIMTAAYMAARRGAVTRETPSSQTDQQAQVDDVSQTPLEAVNVVDPPNGRFYSGQIATNTQADGTWEYQFVADGKSTTTPELAISPVKAVDGSSVDHTPAGCVQDTILCDLAYIAKTHSLNEGQEHELESAANANVNCHVISLARLGKVVDSERLGRTIVEVLAAARRRRQHIVSNDMREATRTNDQYMMHRLQAIINGEQSLMIDARAYASAIQDQADMNGLCVEVAVKLLTAMQAWYPQSPSQIGNHHGDSPNEGMAYLGQTDQLSASTLRAIGFVTDEAGQLPTTTQTTFFPTTANSSIDSASPVLHLPNQFSDGEVITQGDPMDFESTQSSASAHQAFDCIWGGTTCDQCWRSLLQTPQLQESTMGYA